jgi:hypothetical protein
MVVPNVVFCNQDETIQQISFACSFARILWRVIFMTFNVHPPPNITNLFSIG